MSQGPATDTRYRCREITMMLEKIKVAPCEFFEIMCLAHRAAVRARI